MSTETGGDRQAKLREFMSLLPLTIELAGLPHCELGRYFNDGQLEVRATAIRNAYQMARQLLIDISKPAEPQV
jgi:hypothetical protein